MHKNNSVWKKFSLGFRKKERKKSPMQPGQSSRQNPHATGGLGLDGVKRLLVARELIALEQAALLAGRTGAHVCLREGL